MREKCAICGREGADILCGRCGKIVCDRCFDEDEEVCISCVNKGLLNSLNLGGDLLLPGVIVMVIGLMITSLALLSDAIQGEGIVIIFPFVMSGSNGWTAALMTVIFLSILFISTLLPYYLAVNRGGLSTRSEVYYPFYDHAEQITERMEYMITTIIPKRIREKIYIEEGDGEISIKSQGVEIYEKSYELPEGYGVESLDYDYEGEYLLLKLKLIRHPEF